MDILNTSIPRLIVNTKERKYSFFKTLVKDQLPKQEIHSNKTDLRYYREC